MADKVIEELTVKQKQKRDSKENEPFDREMDAFRRGKDNLTDEERIDRLKDNADLRRRLNESIDAKGIQAFAGEMSVGIAADILLPSPDPISRGANFGIGYGANALAQMWAGDEFSHGEAMAAGAFQAIPFGTVAKGFKGISRAAVKGGAGAVVGEQVRVGIDEQRLLKPEEAGIAFATGGVLGGGFKGAIDTAGPLRDKLIQQIDAIPTPFKIAEFAGGTGSGGFAPKSADIDLSKHYKDKLAVHERALNPDMIGFDKRALDRRAKIDAQFELNSRTGLPEGPRNIRAGSTETSRRAKAAWSLGEEVDPKTIKIFEESNQSILDGYNYRLHGKNINVGKTQGHHKGVVRQIFEASNGLNQEYRLESAKYMQNRIGFELGYHGRNVAPVPERFHPRVHAIINSRISSSPDLFNVEGAAKRLGFPKNWQSVLTFEERKPLYNEIADAIRESVDAINTNWEVLLSRSDDLTTYSKEEYLDLMLRHNKLDKKLKEVASPRLMASRKNWDLKDTSTVVINEILSESNAKTLMLPFVGKVESDMSPIVRKVLNEENGWNLFKEMILTDKSSATILKANPKIKLTVSQRTSLDNYIQYIKNIRRGTTPGNIGSPDYETPSQKGQE